MAVIYKTTFQLRRGNAATWAEKNPILAVGEPGFVIDTNKLKIGDGVTAWNDLSYISENFILVDSYSNLPAVANAKAVIYVCEDTSKAYVANSTKTAWLSISGSGSGGAISAIKANGTLLDIVEGVVDIPQASETAFGLIKGSSAINQVKINSDGTAEVNSVGVDKLQNVSGVELILNGGN